MSADDFATLERLPLSDMQLHTRRVFGPTSDEYRAALMAATEAHRQGQEREAAAIRDERERLARYERQLADQSASAHRIA